MLRMVGLVAGLLVVAIGIAVAVQTYGDWRTKEADRKQRQRQVAADNAAHAALKALEPPPLPPLPRVIEPEEVKRILAQAKPQTPNESKGELTWQQIESTLERLRQERRARPQAGVDLE